MTIRTIIMALTIPLFLLMAVVNGAVLYLQEQSELSRGLSDQTLSAAVVAAEFIAEMDDPERELGEPKKQQSLDAAAAHIEGLQGLYLVDQPETVIPLATSSLDWMPPVQWQGQSAQQTVFHEESVDAPFFYAIVPAGEGRAIAARVDAAPLQASRTQIIWISATIIFGVSVISAALSWFVAHRVARELLWTAKNVMASEDATTKQDKSALKIRETRDLSDAVGLMRASQQASETRHQRDTARAHRERSVERAAQDVSAELFADRVIECGPAQIAVQVHGRRTQIGVFYAIVEHPEEPWVVIGQCDHEPQAALANAASARGFIEQNLRIMGVDQCLALARRAFGISRVETLSVEAGEPPLAMACLASDQTTADAKSILAKSDGMTADQLLNAVSALLEPEGIFAAISVNR